MHEKYFEHYENDTLSISITNQWNTYFNNIYLQYLIMIHEILQYINPEYLIHTYGLRGVVGIIFAESGLFFGAVLPGDSLLFLTGVSISTGLIGQSIRVAIWWTIAAALLWNQIGYYFGKYLGVRLEHMEDTFYYKREYVTKAQAFFTKYGYKALIMARFVPIVRAFVPIIAGITKMDSMTFLSANIIGGVLRVGIMLGGSYAIGHQFPAVGKHIDIITVAIILLSVLPIILSNIKKKN